MTTEKQLIVDGNKIRTVALCITTAFAIAAAGFGIGTLAVGAPAMKKSIEDAHIDVLTDRASTVENTRCIRALEVDRAVILERLRSIETKVDKLLDSPSNSS